MSHFTVLVAYDPNKTTLDKVMLPYHEAESTGLSDYCVWDDSIDDEYREEFETETVEVVMHNGKVVGTKYDNSQSIEEMWHIEDGFKKVFVLPAGYDIVDMPVKDYYFNDFDIYMEEYVGCTTKNPETGKYSRFTNPNAQWDWYQVGGRWSGLLITKDGQEVDEEMSQNIDWGNMAIRQQDESETRYDTFWSIYNNSVEVADADNQKYLEWVARNPDVASTIPNAEIMIRTDNAMKAVGAYLWGLETFKKCMLPKEEYCELTGLTYAFIDLDGNWNQKGEMGWWGMDDPSKATECYNGEFWQFVQNIPNDYVVCVVDCHI